MTPQAGTTVIGPDTPPGVRGLLTLVLSSGGGPEGPRFLMSCAHVLHPPGHGAARQVRDASGAPLAEGIVALDFVQTRTAPADVGLARLLCDVDPRIAGRLTAQPDTGWAFVKDDHVRVVLRRAPGGQAHRIVQAGVAVAFRCVGGNGAQILYTLTDQVLIEAGDLAPGDSGAVVVADQEGLLIPVAMFVGLDKEGRGVITPIGAALEAARRLAGDPSLAPVRDLTPMRIERVIPPAAISPVPPGQPLFRLGQPGGRDPWLSGPAMLALQVALGAWGIPVAVDGKAGPNTLNALKQWQGRVGLPQGPEIGLEAWRRLLGGPMGEAAPPPSPFDLCLGVTAAFEGKGFDKAVGNFDGAGLTFGLIGFNVKWGSLGALVARVDQLDRGLIGRCFGSLKPKLRHMLDASVTPDERVRRAQVAQGPNGEIASDWAAAFAALAAHRAARQAQLDIAWTYWEQAAAFWKAACLGAEASLLDMGQCFDIVVQNGPPGGALLEAYAAARARTMDGRARRTAFAEICANHANPRWRNDVLARKLCFVNGQGTVHQGSYRLAEWGLRDLPLLPAAAWAEKTTLAGHLEARRDDAPAPPPSSAATTEPGQGAPADGTIPNDRSPHRDWPDYRDFLAFFRELGLTDFRADEVLVMGASHAAGPCKGLNAYPPRALWPNVAPTLAVLQALRTTFGAPIRITSAYRAPAYNECLERNTPNVARDSQHMQFRALDFTCDNRSPAQVVAQLEAMRAKGLFTGWFRAYDTFTHLDTRQT
jgi:peptidoglycan hydrolase-like protein with peptidoglycan-binding domain